MARVEGDNPQFPPLNDTPLKCDFIAFKINIISIRTCIADMDVVNEVKCTLKNVITCLVI